MELNPPSVLSQNPESESSVQQIPVSQPQSSISPPSNPPQEVIFHQIRSYPFHSDPSYQSGLSAILGHPSTPATSSELFNNQDLVLQAQCFYFARKYNLDPIDPTGYQNFLATNQPVTQGSDRQPSPQENGIINHLARPDPVERPSAPTPATASAASTLSVQPNSQAITSPPTVNSTHNTADPTAAAEGPSPPYPTSFADIVDLITQNKPIPGIEQIPDTVLDPGSSKHDHTARRRKPWETTGTADSNNMVDSRPVDGGAEIVNQHGTGEGVVRILQPGAIPDSGLLAKE